MLETPRTTLSFIAGYRRRRGWLAWQTATLQRFDFPDGYPALDKMMGIVVAEKPEQSDEMAAHNLRLWKAALANRA